MSSITVISAAAPLHSPASPARAPAARGEASSWLHRRQAQAVTRHLMSVYSRLAAWRWRRATRTILYALDDRILNDIGLKRSEITDIVSALRMPPRWPI